VVAFVSVGPLELAVLAIIALLVLGPQRLPEAARSVGRGVREMRDALQGGGRDDEPDGRYAYEDEDLDEEEDLDEDEDLDPDQPAEGKAEPEDREQPAGRS